MQTVQIVLDEILLRAADRAAQRARLNRSALVREALKDYLKKLHTLEIEQLDQKGFEASPDHVKDWLDWEQEAQWPQDG